MIKFYTIDCPRCGVLETKLNQKNIKYLKITDTEVMRQKNIDLLPMLEVNGELMDYKTAISWVNNQEVNE